LRTSGDASALTNPARKAIQDFDVKLPIVSARTVHDLISNELESQTAVAKLSSLFAALALLLACVGLYGLMSYSVAGRTREIGVRMALGASRRNLVWLVLREAMTMVVVGIGVGLPLAMAASRGLRSLLFQATAIDPLPLAASTLLLGSVAAFAAWLPARRASKVDPMVALRYE
jgi:ABC-type antimicrobial peptide transport system permease subunit